MGAKAYARQALLIFAKRSIGGMTWSAAAKIKRILLCLPPPLPELVRKAVTVTSWLASPHRIPTRLRMRAKRKKHGIQAWLATSHRLSFTTDDIVVPPVHLLPLSVFSITRGLRPRILMVTDSLGPSSFFGGVGTATLFAGNLANHHRAGLTLITLRENPYRNHVRAFFNLHRVPLPPRIDFRRVDLETPNYPLDVGSEDLFVTTSWWSTRNVLGSVAAERIIYVLQEDERMFYPAGDNHLRADEIISEPGLRTVVNTRLLYEHFLAAGCSSLRDSGVWFEPAFPENIYFFEPAIRSPLNFFFYARPNNQRNLFARGVETINKAVVSGVLRPKDWRFHFVGKDLGPVRLATGDKVDNFQGLTWDHYANLIRRMDLGLSLMYTPHPSYPPLDLAASGAIAVTNKFGSKISLSNYSNNIVCADLSIEGLVEGLAKGAALAQNAELRLDHYRTQELSRSWEESFAHPLRWLDGG